jgi:hypothetical protein
MRGLSGASAVPRFLARIFGGRPAFGDDRALQHDQAGGITRGRRRIPTALGTRYFRRFGIHGQRLIRWKDLVMATERQLELEIEDMRLVVKFGEKRRYSDSEHEAIYQEVVEAGLNNEAMRDPDAIEAVFKELNAADEAAAARRHLCG